MSRRLMGWTRTGGRGSRGQATARMADGSPNWDLPAHEPDNSPRAVAGRVLGLAGVCGFGLALSGAGLWVNRQPLVREATAAAILTMPGPGVVWQCVELLALLVAAVLAAMVVGRRARRRPARPARVRVRVVPAAPDPGIPTGQLVFRRFDSPALTPPPARPALHTVRDRGSVEVETLAFRIAPPLILLVALVNATGSDSVRPTVFPLVAGAVVLAWTGRYVRRQHTDRQPPPDPTSAPALHEPQVAGCESCRWAPGTVTVTFPDGTTFRVCALCLTTPRQLHGGSAATADPAVSSPSGRRGVQL